METDIKNKDMEVNQKTEELNKLTQELNQARQRINDLVKAGRLSQQQAEDYQFKMEQMQYYVKKYQADIADLQRENQRLTTENKTLVTQIKEKDSVRTQMEEEKVFYQTKIEAASILKAVEFEFIAVNKRGKETSGKELRERKIENLKICFKVLDNEVAPVGERTIYLVVKNPNGIVYKAFETSSGYFKYNGQEIPYTAKVTIQYDRSAQNVCEVYEKPKTEDFMKGTHRVTVYADGFVIGNGSFVVK